MKRLMKTGISICLCISSCTPEAMLPPKGTGAHSPVASDTCLCVNTTTETPMALIKGGSYIPMYGRDSSETNVGDFMLDVYPVTNGQYLAFVKCNPRWRKSKVKQLFGDANYLRGWKNDTTLGEGQPLHAPVTNVSWFAAKAYCECQGKRLPSIDEWEYVAMSDETRPDARKEETYTKYILDWYEKPETFKREVGLTYRNYWGVYDMHGLVWEWTSDFNSVLVSDDSRKGASNDNLFCGGASIGASDLKNYAAFMRYAFRGSLKASYSVKNLGFRCAKDIP